ncbi:uncharacterized protein JCM10292_000142 [Rhodotorula paludigena]|uniref:uncharacterized protein n=1 Tax=Rhodotorula paludigena TaxID=86838 RepID=UPI00316D83FC
MGAVCGKEDHFDSLAKHGSKGHTLGSSPTTPAAAPPAPKSVSTSPPQRLGGAASAAPESADAAARREAMLAAAEARTKASSGRGAPNGGGKLSAQLASQSRDGGRKEEARLEAERRGEQLVWD